ncbi:sulfur carrier protein ThiS [Bacillus taeanensis]|uniref:Thiamine biosynthesis protein ThiS n=1 Tax=Bacillus taeanensis TaxID=273032 RepID=A0A366Y2E1_9BACI|nr:sulfur carrier protein ThiS [Bacillus taeanensis]RBW70564.1 thiamine biosynthesis protein ThiS [Bacillus taeanensis]
MKLIINGEEKQLSVQTLQDVVEHFGLQEGFVVTEVDGEIIDRNNWNSKSLVEGMQIELVHFVGGG